MTSLRLVWLILGAAGLAVCAAVWLGLLWSAESTTDRDAVPERARVAAGPSRPEPPAVRAVQVVERWHAARARAWSTGDLHALAGLYVRGSEAGRRDRAALAAYLSRGLRAQVRTRTDALSVRIAGPDRVVVQEHSAVQAVVARSGRARALPVQWQWRLVELVRRAGVWRLRTAAASSGSPRGPP